MTLPAGYPLPYLRRALSRDPHSVTERLAGDIYETVVPLDDEPALLTLKLSAEIITVIVATRNDLGMPPPTAVESATTGAKRSPLFAAHEIVIGLLGLEQDAAAFVRLGRRLGLQRLVAGRPELRISQTVSVFEGLLWSIIGQQINFAFACQLRRRLIEGSGQPFASGLYAPPTPAAVARLEPGQLRSWKFSRQKSDYLVATARLVAEGKLDLASLRPSSAVRAERTLLAVRGLGPWSVNYLMMRSLGFADCVPSETPASPADSRPCFASKKGPTSMRPAASWRSFRLTAASPPPIFGNSTALLHDDRLIRLFYLFHSGRSFLRRRR